VFDARAREVRAAAEEIRRLIGLVPDADDDVAQ
jgi:hypothetical protein